MKKVLATALALSLLFTATACGGNDGNGGDVFTAGNVRVCTTNSLEKVLQKKAFDSCSSKLQLKAFQNEY